MRTRQRFTAIGKPQYSDMDATPCEITFMADNMQAAKHWIINHCDCSYEWTIYRDSDVMKVAAQ